MGTLGPGHLFGNRSEGTGSPRNPSAENVRLRVGPYPRTTLITSNLTVVSGRFSCNTTTPKAYVFTTTTRIGIKRDPAKRPRSSRPRRSLTPGRFAGLDRVSWCELTRGKRFSSPSKAATVLRLLALRSSASSIYQDDARKLLLVADRFQKEDWSNSPFKGVYPGSLSVPLTYGFRGGRGRLKGGATAPVARRGCTGRSDHAVHLRARILGRGIVLHLHRRTRLFRRPYESRQRARCARASDQQRARGGAPAPGRGGKRARRLPAQAGRCRDGGGQHHRTSHHGSKDPCCGDTPVAQGIFRPPHKARRGEDRPRRDGSGSRVSERRGRRSDRSGAKSDRRQAHARSGQKARLRRASRRSSPS